MSDQMLISTRKGLFTARRGADGWAISETAFIGDNVTLALHDPRSGYSYAALDHGHFGVKMHRNKGEGWQEIAAPAFPEKPDDVVSTDGWGKELPWVTVLVWALETGGPDEPGVTAQPSSLTEAEMGREAWEGELVEHHDEDD